MNSNVARVWVYYVLARRLAAKSVLWYVPLDRNNVTSKLQVPHLESLDSVLQEEGQQAYQKLQTLKRETSNQPLVITCSG
jgi:pyruvate dehydrogenase complex dehydrogenase (E1) component